MRTAFYRRNLPHLQVDYKPHFLTFCTYRRWILPPWARTIVLRSCLHDHGITIDLKVVVVMPDHVHMIFVPLVNNVRREIYPLAQITQSIKSSSAHLINRRLGVKRRIWQEESFDRVLRLSEKLDAKIEYVLSNPVRKGLVRLPQEYEWLWRPDGELRSPAQAGAPGPTLRGCYTL